MAQRALINRRDEQGFYRLSNAGWVDFSKLASTYGGIGLYEAIKILMNEEYNSAYTDEDIDLGNRILLAFNEKCAEMKEKYDVPFSLEFSVPGESAAFRLANRSRIKYGDIVKYNEVSNQYTPLTLDFGITKKLEWEEALSTKVEPTGICHININASLTPKQNVNMNRAMWKAYPNIQYYAFNGTQCLCENGHLEMTETHDEKCIVCSGNIIDRTTRSIGYFKSTLTDFGKNRQNEFKRRKWYSKDSIVDAVTTKATNMISEIK